jgi:hypothetical protein
MNPLEKWSGNKLLVEHLKIFGCRVRAHILDDKRKKLDEKSHAYIMMGCFEELKSYRFLIQPNKKLFVTSPL